MNLNKKYQSILDAAIVLFLEQGIRKTTMEEIAEVAVCSKVTVYKYFKDKDNLLLKASAAIYDDYLSELMKIKDSELDFAGQIYRALNRITEFIASGRFALCNELAGYSKEIDRDNAKCLNKYQSIIIELIQEGKGCGAIRKDIDVIYIFYYIDMSATYYQSNNEYRKLMDNDETFQKDFLRFLIGNIFTDAEGVI